MDVAVARVLQDRLAAYGVAGRIVGGNLPQRGPGADVAPADVDRHHGGGARSLHDGVVDGDAGCLGERLRLETQEAQVLLGAGKGLRGSLQDGGLKARQLVEVGAGAENEDAAVPGVGAGADVVCCRRPVRLLREGFDDMRRRKAAAAEGRGGCSHSRCAVRPA